MAMAAVAPARGGIAETATPDAIDSPRQQHLNIRPPLIIIASSSLSDNQCATNTHIVYLDIALGYRDMAAPRHR